MRAVSPSPKRAVRKGCHKGCYSIQRSEGPTPIVLVFRCRTYSAPFPTSIHIDSPIGLPFQVSHLRRSQSCCFRHLEKPIKTKENKRKHFVFICFYWFSPVFLEGERNGKSVYSVSSVFMFILTTDFQNFRDINHERKRDNPLHLCNLCSRKRKLCVSAPLRLKYLLSPSKKTEQNQ